MLFKKHKHVGGYIGSSIIPESSFISSSASGTYSSNEINVFKKRSKWPLFGEADTYFSNVVLLLAADGINGSVVLNDSSSYNHTINIVGNAELRTDIKKFGLSSLYIFGGSANIASLSSNDWNFNTNDFTIECWIYPTAGIGASRDILSKFTTLSSNLDFLLEIDSANGNLKFSAGNNAAISILSNSAVPLNVWSHVAISRISGVTRMFIDGALQSSTSTGSFSIPNNTTTLTIGKSSTNSDPFSGYIDEIRITRNFGRYSSSFSPYNGRFSNFGLDPTVAPPPTSLTTTAGNAQVSLAWTAPSYTGGSAITDYSVQFSSNSGSTWSTFSRTASITASQVVTGLTNGTAYVFRVAAVNGVGVGAYTAASSSVTPSAGTPPNAPTSLTATPGNTQASLAWVAPSAPGTYAITGYRVEYTPAGGSPQTVSTGSTGTSYTLTGLVNGTTYRVRVAAVSASGDGAYTTSSNVMPSSTAVVTGGTVSTPGDGYTYRTFTSSGTLQISGASLTADVLVVGGGGSGGRNFGGGGGGGGGVLYQTNQSIAAGSYAVTVAITTALDASAGSSSIGSLYSATGGGAGVGLSGYGATAGGSSGLPTSSSSVTANAGGTGHEVYDYGGGGQGGGAGGVGANGIAGQRVNSANGRTVFGVEYGRGGRGGFNITGGGDQAAYNGASNTGNGGSGGGDAFGDGARGTGGSGIVIIRYLTA